MKRILSLSFILLTVIVLTASAGTLPKVELTYSGTLSDEWTEGCTVTYDGTEYSKVSIQWNGSASKLNYRFKLDKKKALIGDTKYKQWILLSNKDDQTKMRNALANEISSQVGMEYTLQYKFVDLYVNGEYAGIYQLTDRIKAEEGRACVSGATGTADDWLVQMCEEGDIEEGDVYVTGTKTMPYIIMKNPDPDDYVSDPTTLEGYRQDMETYFTDVFNNPKNYVKQDEFVAWYLANEIICNYKGFSEIFAYRSASGDDQLLRFGPLWDNEKGFNNNSKNPLDMSDINTEGSYEGLILKFADHKLLRKWVKGIMENTEDTWFRDAVWAKWQTLSGLKQTLLDKITALESEVGTSDAEAALKTYITDRFAYLDVKLAEITGHSASGIKTVTNNTTTSDNAVYSITGQRLSSKPAQGIYIKNGKKMIGE